MAHKLPPPSRDKEPLKRNIYFHLRDAESALTPLFPYLAPGDIVPCGAMHMSKGRSLGSFHHENSVDELLVVWGSNTPRARVGQVFVTTREHRVTGPSADKPGEFFASCITQRQKEHGPQPEAMAYHCDQCRAEIYTLAYDGGHSENLDLPILATIYGSNAWAQQINANEDLRTCKQCGHVNPPFPISEWGWEGHVMRAELLNASRSDLQKSIVEKS